PWLSQVDPQIRAAVEGAIAELKQLGATIVPLEIAIADVALAAYYIIATAEASSNLARYDGVRYGLRVDDDSLGAMVARTRAAGFGAEVKRRIMLGTYVLRAGYYDAYYKRAQQVRTLVRNEFARAFKDCAVMVTPTTPTTAFKLGEKLDDPLKMYLND